MYTKTRNKFRSISPGQTFPRHRIMQSVTVLRYTAAGFIFCSLFNADSYSDRITPNDWMMVNNELETMWKEAAVA
jgi:hypothetical protein